jgi:excisionase family DNA binding protein
VSAIDPAVVQAVLALAETAPDSAARGRSDAADGAAEPGVATAAHRPGRFLTVAQVAEELAVSESTVGALIRRGRLPALKVDGRHWRIERAKLEELIAQAYATPPDTGTASGAVGAGGSE